MKADWRTLFLTTPLAAALWLAPLPALAADRGDPIKELLYPAELIIEHSDALKLDEQQEETIREELRNTQAAVFDIRWEMKDEGLRLAELLRQVPVDEQEVLDQADTVMALEHQVKRAHLAMLVRLKNLMTPEQLDMLAEYRQSWTPRDRGGRAGR